MCNVAAFYHQGQISVMMSAPPDLMGELPKVPPVIDQKGVLHMYKLAAAQRRDPVISWFVYKVVKRETRAKINPRYATEGPDNVADQVQDELGHILQEAEGVAVQGPTSGVPPALRRDLIWTAHTVERPLHLYGHSERQLGRNCLPKGWQAIRYTI